MIFSLKFFNNYFLLLLTICTDIHYPNIRIKFNIMEDITLVKRIIQIVERRKTYLNWSYQCFLIYEFIIINIQPLNIIKTIDYKHFILSYKIINQQNLHSLINLANSAWQIKKPKPQSITNPWAVIWVFKNIPFVISCAIGGGVTIFSKN